MTAETLTRQTRRLLDRESVQEFRVSRAALEALVADSERYAALNQRISAGLVAAQELRRDGLNIYGGDLAVADTAKRVWTLVDAVLGPSPNARPLVGAAHD